MRRLCVLIGVVLLAACSTSNTTTPPTENSGDAAAESAVAVNRALLDGDADAVLSYLNDECRNRVDENQIRESVAGVTDVLDSFDIDAADVMLAGRVTNVTDATTTVNVTFEIDDPAVQQLLGRGDDFEMTYNGSQWVLVGCNFAGGPTPAEDDLDAELAELGVTATAAEPAPATMAVPIGGGWSVRVIEQIPDAISKIAAQTGLDPTIEPGTELLMFRIAASYNGAAEPASLFDFNVEAIGTSGRVFAATVCGFLIDELGVISDQLLSGGAVEGLICFQVPTEDADRILLSFESTAAERSVVIDPTAVGEQRQLPTSTGPTEGAALTAARQAAVPLGTAITLPQTGFTVTVTDANLDATEIVDQSSPVPNQLPDGFRNVLVDVDIAFTGTDDALAPSFLDFGLVGDSNVWYPTGCGNELDGLVDLNSDLKPGESTSGSLCFVLPDGDVESAQLVVTEAATTDYQFAAID